MCVSQHAVRQTHPTVDGYCCGRYASYWNVFLFLAKILQIIICGTSSENPGSDATLSVLQQFFSVQEIPVTTGKSYKMENNKYKIKLDYTMM